VPEYRKWAERIPWRSRGRDTKISRVARSILPVGILPFTPVPPPSGGIPGISINHPDAEKFLMNIVGTAIQVGAGKLVTCAHVAEILANQEKSYVLSPTSINETVIFVPYRIVQALRYIDPRTDKINPKVDMALLIVPAVSTSAIPYRVPPIRWGKSSHVGVGDSVIIGGYPLGTEMFRLTRSNRSIVQPTFYGGIVSAILPATTPEETRLFQVAISTLGGISGGPMIQPGTGRVLGIVTSGVTVSTQPGDSGSDVPLPMSYVLPSEVIAPFAQSISFETQDASGRHMVWR